VYARHPEPVNALVSVGAVGATSLEDLVKKLNKPRAIWLMIPTPMWALHPPQTLPA
jgi:6-phosphogluconate dehydrogenase